MGTVTPRSRGPGEQHAGRPCPATARTELGTSSVPQAPSTADSGRRSRALGPPMPEEGPPTCPRGTHLGHAAHVLYGGPFMRELGEGPLDLGDDGVYVHRVLRAAAGEVEGGDAPARGGRQGLLLPRLDLRKTRVRAWARGHLLGMQLSEGLGTWAPPRDPHSVRAWARGHLLGTWAPPPSIFIIGGRSDSCLPPPPQAQFTHCGRGTQTITTG